MVNVRKRTVRRMQAVTYILVFIAILLFFYSAYKYLYYSADCNPKNALSLQVNSLFNMLGMGIGYLFWLIPVLCFFWPTASAVKEERNYRRVRKRFSSISSRSTVIQSTQEDFESSSDDSNDDSNQFSRQNSFMNVYAKTQIIQAESNCGDNQSQTSESQLQFDNISLRSPSTNTLGFKEKSHRNVNKSGRSVSDNQAVAFLGVQEAKGLGGQEQELLETLKKKYERNTQKEVVGYQ